MKIINENKIETFFARLEKRASLSADEDNIQKIVRTILADVRKQGDLAVINYTEKFDSIKLKKLLIDAGEIDAAAGKVEKQFLKWKFTSNGITTGQIIRPLERIGAYVPGGKAAYPSTVLMNVIPAQVAGVMEIALCVPTPSGKLNRYVAAAIKLLGVKEVYRIGGAQAIAALTYGTKTIKKVDKIVGPGNIFVAVAKKMVFGEVGVDMVAGPSEILIIADRSANPKFIASDLLSQAEHDEMASSVLITNSVKLARDVETELKIQLKNLKRRDIAFKSASKYGAIIITKSLGSAVEISNRIAPEHLEIMTKKPSAILPEIKNAGAVFLGQWTPEPLGDYAAGPNHTLPTSSTARFSSPLGVYDFIKRTSLISSSRSGFMNLAGTVETFADIEGLEAHGNTVRVRQSGKDSHISLFLCNIFNKG
jgi:histidinol dehydrogenase